MLLHEYRGVRRGENASLGYCNSSAVWHVMAVRTVSYKLHVSNLTSKLHPIHQERWLCSCHYTAPVLAEMGSSGIY